MLDTQNKVRVYIIDLQILFVPRLLVYRKANIYIFQYIWSSSEMYNSVLEWWLKILNVLYHKSDSYHYDSRPFSYNRILVYLN